MTRSRAAAIATAFSGIALAGMLQAAPAQADMSQLKPSGEQALAAPPTGCITWRSNWAIRNPDGSLTYGQQANAQCDTGRYFVKAACGSRVVKGGWAGSSVMSAHAPNVAYARCATIDKETITVVPDS